MAFRGLTLAIPCCVWFLLSSPNSKAQTFGTLNPRQQTQQSPIGQRTGGVGGIGATRPSMGLQGQTGLGAMLPGRGGTLQPGGL